jgi:predicted DCC family thiol-disulfide oxidoreductase YuxK
MQSPNQMGQPSPLSSPYPIVFFDGVCNLCNGAVTFILERDIGGRLRFAALQSNFAAKHLPALGKDPREISSILVLDEGRVLSESDAVLRISEELSRPWRWLSAFRVLPRFLRNALYRLIARNRYRLFGKRESCRIPKEGEAERFLT